MEKYYVLDVGVRGEIIYMIMIGMIFLLGYFISKKITDRAHSISLFYVFGILIITLSTLISPVIVDRRASQYTMYISPNSLVVFAINIMALVLLDYIYFMRSGLAMRLRVEKLSRRRGIATSLFLGQILRIFILRRHYFDVYYELESEPGITVNPGPCVDYMFNEILILFLLIFVVLYFVVVKTYTVKSTEIKKKYIESKMRDKYGDTYLQSGL